jgi:WXXGXW repeat (2 copies)
MKITVADIARRPSRVALSTAVTLLASAAFNYGQAPDSSTAPPVPAAELPAGSELLTQGPVHEAFAKPVPTDPQAPLVISQQPPAVLQEVPPSEKPAGANIVWVPGYWAWDETRNDFIWVSGCWRNAPPNTYWVPGHWLQLDSGWEWIAGFWKPLGAQGQPEIEYLPAPPAAFEAEAVGSPPTPDQIWVPGCWYWSEGHYIQRHGYWMAPQLGWVWVPSHYAWTPRGYIFASGHWDHDFDNRGVLFSPVYFPAPVRVQVGFVFSPGLCVDLGMLQLNLFVNPRYNHYCFGDYYDASYQRAGIYPWFQCQTLHTWYDPLFVYNKWHFEHTDPGWATRQAQQFKQLQANRDLRPAHTYRELETQYNRLPAAKRPQRPLAEPIKTYAAAQSTPVKFERINATERQQYAARTSDVSTLRTQRASWEAPPGPKTSAEPSHQPAPQQAPAHQTPSREVAAHPEPAPKPAPFKPAPAPAVRVTKPEREVVKTPVIAPKPSESRYIEKTSPGQQALENPHTTRGSQR